MMRTLTILGLLCVTALAGCSTEDAGAPPPAGSDVLLEPPAQGQGVQYRMTSTVEPGQEIERCRLVKAPPEGLFVTHDEVRFSRGSHHILLYRTPYTEIPTETRGGAPINAAEVHDCESGAPGEWEVNGIAAGSQSFEGGSILGSLPEGVALKVEPGAVMVMNTHYLNASSERIEVDARINLYTTPPEKVKIEAGVLFHFNDFIRIPANGSASARMRCKLNQDMSLVNVQSHMHKRGVGFVANVVSSDGGSMEELYTNDSWEEVPVKELTPALELKAGQALDYRCDYMNPEARDVLTGLTTRDEMCVLLGAYYPRDPRVEYCGDEQGDPADVWVGSGTATCAETLACFINAKPTGDDVQSARTACVVNGCPGAAEPIARALHCTMNAGREACWEACKPGGDCEACIAEACKAEVDTCQAATCG